MVSLSLRFSGRQDVSRRCRKLGSVPPGPRAPTRFLARLLGICHSVSTWSVSSLQFVIDGVGRLVLRDISACSVYNSPVSLGAGFVSKSGVRCATGLQSTDARCGWSAGNASRQSLNRSLNQTIASHSPGAWHPLNHSTPESPAQASLESYPVARDTRCG